MLNETKVTNASLTNDYNRKFRKTLLPPFDDMVEDLSLYTIQLSLYALMLEDIGVSASTALRLNIYAM